jgi:hypothetical protein
MPGRHAAGETHVFTIGNTATATYPKVSGSTTNTFFKAKIEER